MPPRRQAGRHTGPARPIRHQGSDENLTFSMTGSVVGAFSQAKAKRSSASNSSSWRWPQAATAALTASVARAGLHGGGKGKARGASGRLPATVTASLPLPLSIHTVQGTHSPEHSCLASSDRSLGKRLDATAQLLICQVRRKMQQRKARSCVSADDWGTGWAPPHSS